MLSTHIMQEVEAMCSRVIIINRGKIVADDSTEALSKKMGGKNRMQVQFKASIDAKVLKDHQGILAVDVLAENRYIVDAENDVDLPELLFKFAVENDTIILEQKQLTENLEQVFQQLTKNV